MKNFFIPFLKTSKNLDKVSASLALPHYKKRMVESRGKPSSIFVNHVMSDNIESNIFKKFIGYLSDAPESRHKESVEAHKDADVYHYHRIHIEKNPIASPSIVTVHHDLEENDPWLQFSRFSTPYKMATKIVCRNRKQECFLNENGFENTIIIPHGYHKDFFPHPHSRENKEDHKVTLGLASKRYARRVKGEATLLEIVKRLDPSLFRFLLVGKGRSYEAVQLEAMGYEVSVFEHLPYRLYNDIYRKMDALLILSGHEGGPACVPEAMATATPMIATPVGMVNDYLVDNKNGILLSSDIDYDSQRILSLGNNIKELRKMQMHAYNMASNAWTWGQVSQAYDEVYRGIIG